MTSHMQTFIFFFKRFLAFWHGPTASEWHPTSLQRMRRRVKGAWQYRDMTKEEAEEEARSMAW